MLKFFRNIRRKLLAQKKIGQYLKYAIGEIILVVIGILIALQINNWNENNQHRQKINTFLFNLKEDLQNDISNMDQLKSSNLFRFYSMQYLLKMADEKGYDPLLDETKVPNWEIGNRIWQEKIPETYDSAFVHLAFLWTHRLGRDLINLNTVEELKSTGYFSQISNSGLKAAVNNYYDLCEFRILRGMPINKEDIKMWQNSLLKDGVVNSQPFLVENPLALIRNHPERAGSIRQMMRNAAWFVEGADVVSLEAHKLIQIIENELHN